MNETSAPRSHGDADPGSGSGVLAGVDERPGSVKPDAILTVDGVARRFGGLTAVAVEHLEIQRGLVTALIGPNGAGKTTLFNVLTGFDRADSGTWSFDGQPFQRLPSHRIARRGLVRTFQMTKALARMPVIENMKLGVVGQGGERLHRSLLRPLWRHQEQEIEKRADELLARFNLTRVRDDFAGELSGGQRKLLEMARALMAEPRLLLLDEPMAGVNPALAETIMEHVAELRDEGMTVLFVEHDMDVVRTISDWVVVMGDGEIIAEGRHASIVRDPRVIDAYLGTHHSTPVDAAEQQRHLDEDEAVIATEPERGSHEGDAGDEGDGGDEGEKGSGEGGA